jgi:D-aminopeptidase
LHTDMKNLVLHIDSLSIRTKSESRLHKITAHSYKHNKEPNSNKFKGRLPYSLGDFMKAPALGISIGNCDHGEKNTISDVDGITIGHCTLKEGKGKLIPGKGPVRTGVTAIIPHRGNIFKEKLLANCYVINGYCKPIGLVQVRELGVLETPIVLTNTLSVGVAADAVIQYVLESNIDIGVTTGSVNPLVLECNDSYLNDIRGGHVKKEHVLKALRDARSDFDEGAVGAGTGMSAFELKGGIGSSSRIIKIQGNEITVGALVLSNFGKREDLLVSGVPVGRELKDWPSKEERNGKKGEETSRGSIIMIVATDAYVTARQLGRIARRAVMGLARTGGNAYNGSGDIVLAFSTAQKIPHYTEGLLRITALSDNNLNLLFTATAEAVEEAIITSLLQAEAMEGRDGRVRYKIPEKELKKIMKKYGR